MLQNCLNSVKLVLDTFFIFTLLILPLFTYLWIWTVIPPHLLESHSSTPVNTWTWEKVRLWFTPSYPLKSSYDHGRGFGEGIELLSVTDEFITECKVQVWGGGGGGSLELEGWSLSSSCDDSATWPPCHEPHLWHAFLPCHSALEPITMDFETSTNYEPT